MSAFREKIQEIVRKSGSESQETLIWKLNPVIRGWATYHQHIVASQAFKRADHVIWRILWQWAKRRHPDKSSGWVAEKYWHLSRRRGWTFVAETSDQIPDGKPVQVRLVNAVDTHIRPHRRIKKDANPFDPRWRGYFEERVLLKRYGSELLEKYGWLFRKPDQKSVVQTGSVQTGP